MQSRQMCSYSRLCLKIGQQQLLRQPSPCKPAAVCSRVRCFVSSVARSSTLLWQLTLTLSHHNLTWSLFAGHVLHQFPSGQGRIRGIAEKPSVANTGRLVAGGGAPGPAAGGRASVGPRVLTDMGTLTGHLVVVAAVSG